MTIIETVAAISTPTAAQALETPCDDAKVGQLQATNGNDIIGQLSGSIQAQGEMNVDMDTLVNTIANALK
jgi:hypothetical protein